jgi:1,4-dihydroxy-6-naphthoate synthase
MMMVSTMASTPALTLGYSPCPNDTFIFYALTHGIIELPGMELAAPLLDDVETLNGWALEHRLDVTKLSFHALGHVLDEYCLLSAGSALGRGCGPLLVARGPLEVGHAKPLRVAIPGRLTTAALLFRLYLSSSWSKAKDGPVSRAPGMVQERPKAKDGPVSRAPGMVQERPKATDGPVSRAPGMAQERPQAKDGQVSEAERRLRVSWAPGMEAERVELIEMRFDTIMEAIRRGEVDAGVIIHESRFTYGQQGLVCVQDLGQWWEESTGHPIPLGCIAARRSLGGERIAAIDQAIRASIDWAFAHPEACLPYIREHAQELDPKVMLDHIGLYVNDFSRELGPEGTAAIAAFLKQGRDAGILPDLPRGLGCEEDCTPET